MLSKDLLRDDSAVSPVIGVILMVAITVILAAVIASFVLGLGPGQAAPTASFDIESEDNDVVVTFDSGQEIEASALSVQFDGENEGISDTVEFSDGDAPYSATHMISTGDSVSLSDHGDTDDPDDIAGSYDVSVVWQSGGSSQTIDEGTVTV